MLLGPQGPLPPLRTFLQDNCRLPSRSLGVCSCLSSAGQHDPSWVMPPPQAFQRLEKVPFQTHLKCNIRSTPTWVELGPSQVSGGLRLWPGALQHELDWIREVQGSFHSHCPSQTSSHLQYTGLTPPLPSLDPEKPHKYRALRTHRGKCVARPLALRGGRPWELWLPVGTTAFPVLGWEDPREKEMATHSSILARRIPWTEEPGGLRHIGLQRVRHN